MGGGGAVPDVGTIFNALQRPAQPTRKVSPQHPGRGKWGSQVPKVIATIMLSLSA